MEIVLIVNTVLALMMLCMLVVSIMITSKFFQVVRQEDIDVEIVNKDDFIKIRRKSYEDYIKLAMEEIKDEEGIYSIILELDIPYTEKVSGSYSRGIFKDYFEKTNYVLEKRIYISHENHDELHSRLILGKDEFVNNTAYLVFEEVYDSFALYSMDHDQLMNHKDGLKLVMRQKLSDYYVDILDK